MGKERLEEELVGRSLAVPGPELDMLMELFDTYSTQVRIKENRQWIDMYNATLNELSKFSNDSLTQRSIRQFITDLEVRNIELSTTKHNEEEK